jgi:hypothetical protein
MAKYSAGSNNPGYLPNNVEDFDDFDEAKGYVIDEMLVDADWRGDVGDEDWAEELTNAAEDVNLESSPFETEIRGIVYWVMDNDE